MTVIMVDHPLLGWYVKLYVAPADYQPEARTITFSSSVSNVSITITIVDDSILESTENFLVNLADPQSQIGVSTMPNTANVDIVDNDGKLIDLRIYSIIKGASTPPPPH